MCRKAVGQFYDLPKFEQTVEKSLGEGLKIIGAIEVSGEEESTWTWKLVVPTELRMNERYSQVHIYAF